ncbi:MAG TPA: VWA domain-containing protein [Bacteroidia bacterium]
MIQFENKAYLWAYLLVPVLLLLYIWLANRRKKQLKKLGDIILIEAMIPNVSGDKRTIKVILWFLAFCSLIFAIANLQTGSKMQDVKREGGDLMICLDVSNSMLAEDLSPNRLERAKQALEKFIDKLEGDRIGIIVFAGDAYVQLPITSDYGAAKLFLGSISPGIVPVQGTNIAEAINLSMESFGEDIGKNKSIIIITDGEDHEEGAIKAAEDAAAKNVIINTIGVGSATGVPIPAFQNGMKSGFRKDKEGNTVVTKLNEKLLLDIASAGKGAYVKANNADVGLGAIMGKLNELERKQIESKMYTDYDDQYIWGIYAAIFFLLIDFFINERTSEWWKKLNLFGSENNS